MFHSVMKRLELEPKQSFMGNFSGAFADGAILFPLMAALSIQMGMNGSALLATAGIAYISAGVLFRVPMAVQPLKSVVVAALAIGASAAEVGLSGFIVGLCCLVFSFCKANRLAALVPRHLIHGLQIALGIMLMTKGMHSGFEVQEPYLKLAFIAVTFLIILFSIRTDKPVMGWVAAFGLLIGVASVLLGKETASVPSARNEALQIEIILALVLPQLVLTLANSVVGTHDVAQRYFGDKAKYVTPAWLLRSIGIGNIITFPLGGLPYCHGAGGVTAHVKGGAKNWHMNLIIGGVLIALSMLSLFFLQPLIPSYPQTLMASLLVTTGWFHVLLAKPSWNEPGLRMILLCMGSIALITQSMLWVLAAGVICEGARHMIKRLEGISR